jgi:hypothetical protein
MGCRCKILKVLFCSDTNIDFIVNDVEGNITLYTIEKYIWVNLKNQRLFEKTDSIYYDIKTHTLQSARQIVALCTLNNVIVISVRPDISPMHRIGRPEEVYQSKIPNIELGKCEIITHSNANKNKPLVDVMCISWGKDILIYRFFESSSNYEIAELVYKFSQ